MEIIGGPRENPRGQGSIFGSGGPGGRGSAPSGTGQESVPGNAGYRARWGGNEVRSLQWCHSQVRGSASSRDMAVSKSVNTESSFRATCQQKGETKKNVHPHISKKQRLGQINRLAAMMLTPTRKNAPTAALEIIHDLMPLELALQETALNAYHRLKLMPQASWTNNKV